MTGGPDALEMRRNFVQRNSPATELTRPAAGSSRSTPILPNPTRSTTQPLASSRHQEELDFDTPTVRTTKAPKTIYSPTRDRTHRRDRSTSSAALDSPDIFATNARTAGDLQRQSHQNEGRFQLMQADIAMLKADVKYLVDQNQRFARIEEERDAEKKDREAQKKEIVALKKEVAALRGTIAEVRQARNQARNAPSSSVPAEDPVERKMITALVKSAINVMHGCEAPVAYPTEGWPKLKKADGSDGEDALRFDYTKSATEEPNHAQSLRLLEFIKTHRNAADIPLARDTPIEKIPTVETCIDIYKSAIKSIFQNYADIVRAKEIREWRGAGGKEKLQADLRKEEAKVNPSASRIAQMKEELRTKEKALQSLSKKDGSNVRSKSVTVSTRMAGGTSCRCTELLTSQFAISRCKAH